MNDDRDRTRLAVEARSASVSLSAATVAGMRFVGENEDGSTTWRVPDRQGEQEIRLQPGDLMRYGLTDRMREALAEPLLAPPSHEDPAAPLVSERKTTPLPEPARPTLRLVEGRTDDGWRWSVVQEQPICDVCEGRGKISRPPAEPETCKECDGAGRGLQTETLIALDNKPCVDEARIGHRLHPELQRVVVPLDVLMAITEQVR